MPRTLAEHLRRVPDPRIDRTKKHALGDVLTVATCAILCGYTSYYDMEDFCTDYFGWLRQWLELTGGVPSHDTFRRVLGLVSPAHFGNVFRQWTEAVWRRVEEDRSRARTPGPRKKNERDGGKGGGIAGEDASALCKTRIPLVSIPPLSYNPTPSDATNGASDHRGRPPDAENGIQTT